MCDKHDSRRVKVELQAFTTASKAMFSVCRNNNPVVLMCSKVHARDLTSLEGRLSEQGNQAQAVRTDLAALQRKAAEEKGNIQVRRTRVRNCRHEEERCTRVSPLSLLRLPRISTRYLYIYLYAHASENCSPPRTVASLKS